MKKLLKHPILFGFAAALFALIFANILVSVILIFLSAVVPLSGMAEKLCTTTLFLLLTAGFFLLVCRYGELQVPFFGSSNSFGTCLLLSIPLAAELIFHGVNLIPVLPWKEITVTHLVSPLLTGLCPGVSEELIFRGLVMGNMMRLWKHKKYGISAAVLASSLIFAALHLAGLTGQSVAETLVQGLFCIPFGLTASAVYARTRCLTGLILIHSFFDGFLMFLKQFPAAANYSGNSMIQVGIMIFWAVWGLYLIRPSKQDEILEQWT